MSLCTLIIKSIFFLALTIGIQSSDLPIKQSIKKENSNSTKSTEYLGEILFVANVNGAIENCDCGNPPLGGLPKIQTIIENQKSICSYSYFIDGGDFFNTYPYPLLNEAVVDIYKSMNFTFITLGDQEWIDSDKLDKKIIVDLKDKIIASNIDIDDIQLNKYGTIELKDGTKAKVLSYFDDKSFYTSEDKKLIQFNNDQFVSVYESILAETDLVILIFHGINHSLEWIKRQFPKINLILYAHEQSNVKVISEKPAIVGGGADGEYIKQIKIYRNSNKYNFKVNDIPVSANINGDKKILTIIEKFNKENKLEKGN